MWFLYGSLLYKDKNPVSEVKYGLALKVLPLTWKNFIEVGDDLLYYYPTNNTDYNNNVEGIDFVKCYTTGDVKVIKYVKPQSYPRYAKEVIKAGAGGKLLFFNRLNKNQETILKIPFQENMMSSPFTLCPSLLDIEWRTLCIDKNEITSLSSFYPDYRNSFIVFMNIFKPSERYSGITTLFLYFNQYNLFGCLDLSTTENENIIWPPPPEEYDHYKGIHSRWDKVDFEVINADYYSQFIAYAINKTRDSTIPLGVITGKLVPKEGESPSDFFNIERNRIFSLPGTSSTYVNLYPFFTTGGDLWFQCEYDRNLKVVYGLCQYNIYSEEITHYRTDIPFSWNVSFPPETTWTDNRLYVTGDGHYALIVPVTFTKKCLTDNPDDCIYCNRDISPNVWDYGRFTKIIAYDSTDPSRPPIEISVDGYDGYLVPSPDFTQFAFSEGDKIGILDGKTLQVREVGVK